jgi:regulator of sigma E protease
MILTVLFGVVGFGIMVFVHELGHFVAAKRVGIVVEAFSLGWGRRLVGFSYKGTDYRISMIPFGGFCKMKGEDPRTGRGQAGDGAFFSAAAWKRIIVAAAGPLANVVFAVLVLTAIWWIGFKVYSDDNRIILASDYTLDLFREPPAATRAGLRTGDRIVAIDGKATEKFQDILEAVSTSPRETLKLEVLRDGSRLTVSLVPDLDLNSGAGKIGVYAWQDPVISKVLPGGAAALAGLQEGDRIVAAAVPGAGGMTDVPHTIALYQLLAASPPRLELRVQRGGSIRNATLIPTYNERGVPELGLAFRLSVYSSPRLGPSGALARGLGETWQTVVITVKGIGLLFRGVNFRNAVAGPLRITYYVGAVATSGFSLGFSHGLVSYLRFLCLLSVVLFLMNLLPIPGLDGGQVLVYALEAARRRPLNPKVIARIQMISFSFIILVAVLITFSDIMFFMGR